MSVAARSEAEVVCIRCGYEIVSPDGRCPCARAADEPPPGSRAEPRPRIPEVARQARGARSQETGRLFDGRLRIVEHLGSGGPASYYRAEHLDLGRPCVLALALPETSSDPALRSRFLAPARLRTLVSHPDVLAVYEVSDETGKPAWWAGEFLDGAPLYDVMEARGDLLPLAEALPLARRMAAGLDAVHAAGIVHRDVTPQWFLVGRGENPPVKLVISAEAIGPDGLSGLDMEGRLFAGSSVFLAPEEPGEPADRRSDLWSFGLTLYLMLTGTVPQYHETFVRTFFGILREEMPWIRDLASRVRIPHGTELALRTLVEPDPARRPPNATAAVEAMIRFARY